MGRYRSTFAPSSNTNLTRFDAIIVLGSPADADGNPTPEQLARVTEGVREYERDVAPRLIFTGGPAHNRFCRGAGDGADRRGAGHSGVRHFH